MNIVIQIGEKDMDRKKIGKRIQKIRYAKRMDVKDFAGWIGIDISTLYGYERGKRSPSAMVLYDIAEKTGFSLDWIYGLSERERIC